MEHNVFISYNVEDTAVADAVCAGLEAGGVRCWITSRDILPDKERDSAIINAIGASKLMVLIVSTPYNDSPNVASEVTKAINSGIPIWPFRHAAIEPTGTLEENIQRLLVETRSYLDIEAVPLASKPARAPRAAKQVERFDPHKLPAGDQELADMLTMLEETISWMGLKTPVVSVQRGPRVARFELAPLPGTRVIRFQQLADHLVIALGVVDVRVEMPIPRTSHVGIEIPLKKWTPVSLLDLLNDKEMLRNSNPLAFPLGKDTSGKVRVADLTKLPHLLIGGCTNTGKSVFLNTMICSLISRNTPEQLKLLLIDPKRIELSQYADIPHLLAPIASAVREAAGILRWAIREMESRYSRFADTSTRNITSFNARFPVEALPFIVIIIDELADLMIQAKSEFESSICRLAQLARATGIHLVISTQRPSVNVITGIIRANVPSRIVFGVASLADSRNILDMNGAERLVGHGDMLYLPVEAARPLRIQGAFASEQEIGAFIAHAKTQGTPAYVDILTDFTTDAEEELNDSEDELFAQALVFLRTKGNATTSMLQREFRIGYVRAARMIDCMQERGYVGPINGNKPREILDPKTG